MLSVCICHLQSGAEPRSHARYPGRADRHRLGKLRGDRRRQQCTDDTAGRRRSRCGATASPARREQTRARECAKPRAREFRGGWVIFTNDDVVLERDWLLSYTEAFEHFLKQALPPAGSFLWKTAPGWFKGERLDLIDGVLRWYDLGTAVRATTSADRSPSGPILRCAERLLKNRCHSNQASA